MVTHHTATLTWKVNPDDEDNINGFELRVRNELEPLDVWDTSLLAKHNRKHILNNLACGNKFIAKMTAYNDLASGQPSNDIHFLTSGRRKF